MLFSKISQYFITLLLLSLVVACAQTGGSAGKKRQPNITPLAEAQKQTTTDYAENYENGTVDEAVESPYEQEQIQQTDDPFATVNELSEEELAAQQAADQEALDGVEQTVDDSFEQNAQDTNQSLENAAVVDGQSGSAVAQESVEPLTVEQRFGPNPYLTSAPAIISEQAKTSFQEALILFQSGDDAQAEAKMKLLVDSESDLSGPAYNLAYFYYQNEKLDEALKYAQIAVERNGKNLDARNLLAAVYRAKSDFAQSEQAYLDLLQVWGGYLPAYRNLGILYDLYMGQSEKAYPYYKDYNTYTNNEDKQVVGWALVIERRMKAQQAAAAAAQTQADQTATDTTVEATEGEVVENTANEGVQAAEMGAAQTPEEQAQ